MKRLVFKLGAALEDTFFHRQGPLNLAIFRILLYFYVFQALRSVSTQFENFSGVREPVGIYHLLPLLPDQTLGVLRVVALVACAACLCGLAFRPASATVALLAPYLIGLPNNYGKVNHSRALLVIATVILAFSHADHALSLQRLLKKGAKSVAKSAEYRWPLAVVWLSVGLLYTAGGYSKITLSGIEWALSDNLRNLLVSYHFHHSPPTSLGLWLSDFPVLCKALAAGALLLELGCLLLLLGPPLRLLVGASLAALQLGIYLLMGIHFTAMIPLYACFVPWDQLLHLLRSGGRRLARRPTTG